MFDPARISASLCLCLTGACAGVDPPDADGGASFGDTSGGENGDTQAGSTASDAGGEGSDEVTSSGSGETTVADDGTSDGGAAPGAWCGPVPQCEAPLPTVPTLPWNDEASAISVALGSPHHRGRDFFYREDDEQWLIGKFTYGLSDKDIHGEQVDIYLLRDCVGDFELIGTALTTLDRSHPTVEGVDDSGGRVYFQIPDDMRLGPGRHRVHFIVRGDGSRTDAFIDVVPSGAPVIVTDVDGTLTTAEAEEFSAFLTGATPAVQPGAPQALGALVERGYHILYLTARPEFLVQRTRDFVRERGLPRGLIHTTLGLTGALGAEAIQYKDDELAALAARGLLPSYAFGNSSSDGDAYQHAAILPVDQRFFVAYDDAWGGRRIESFTEVIAEFEAVPDLCP